MAEHVPQPHNQIPYTPGAIERPRLLSRLERTPPPRLTLICAPPGYGKTTLASQFARQSPHPVAWHTLEERERDVPNLYEHCVAELEAIAPGIGDSVPPASDYSSTELAILIADHLREALTDSAVYVLDDVHHLDGAPSAEVWLRTLVERLPRTCHLVLVSRTLPSLPFAEMIARNEVLALGQEDLRLTEEEVYDLAQRTLQTPLPDERIRSLVARLEGWPAGIMLALQPLPADLGAAMLKGEGGPEALFEALADSMLRAQPPDLRHFLLTSSTLSRLTPELCSAVLDLPNSAEWIAVVQSRNLFVSHVSGNLVYHTLFRDFLQRQLKSSDPARFIELHLRAAQWFEERDDIDSAFDHYMAAGKLERAGEIAERASGVYFGQGKVETLLSWSSRLSEFQAEVPRLSLECATIHIDRYEYDAAEAELNRAMQAFNRRADESGIAKVQLQQAWINLQRGRYREAAELAAPLVQSASPEMQGRALRVIGLVHLHLGDVTTSVQYLEKALTLHREVGLCSALSHLLQDLQVVYTRLGRLEDAGACLQEVVALRRELGGAGPLALALNNLGYYYHQRSNYRQALLTFREGLRVIAGIPARRAESYLLWSLGDLKRDLGHFDGAKRLYDKALELLPRDSEPHLQISILVSQATLRRWQGRLEEAHLLAEEALKVARKYDMAFERAMAQAAVWAVRAQLGAVDEACDELASAVSDLHEQGARYELTGVLGTCAYANLLRSETSEARRYLEMALEMAEEVESGQPLAAELVHTPKLEKFAGQTLNSPRLEHELAQLLKARSRLAAEMSVDEMDGIHLDTYSLRVLTLGQEAIERDGELITSSQWRTTTAKAIFLYLLFMGPQSFGDLALVFWADSHPDQIRTSFHTTIHRARGALGKNVILFEEGRYFINPELAIWCDALEMEELVKQARPLPLQDARTEDLWRKAVALYKGDFLPSLDAEWIVSQREALGQMYLEALVNLGQCARARHDLKAALSLFERALEVNPYREDIHRAVMTCYAELGQKTQIFYHFNRLRRLLKEELGIEPAQETKMLAQMLLA